MTRFYYKTILSELVKDETLDAQEVLLNLINWLNEDEVYMFCQDEYDVATNTAYKSKHDGLVASKEENNND
jgi:hypothetical protein